MLPFGLQPRSRHQRLAGRRRRSDALSVNDPRRVESRRAHVAVSLAPSLAGSVLGALDFLDRRIPYGCTEQTLSSFLPNLMVTRALAQLKLAPTERLSALDRQVPAASSASTTSSMTMADGDGGRPTRIIRS